MPIFGTPISRADLSGADLSGARLLGAQLAHVRTDYGTTWPAGITAAQQA
jgi:uncharacterized protein YjbI with pentapeptide repeats